MPRCSPHAHTHLLHSIFRLIGAPGQVAATCLRSTCLSTDCTLRFARAAWCQIIIGCISTVDKHVDGLISQKARFDPAYMNHFQHLEIQNKHCCQVVAPSRNAQTTFQPIQQRRYLATKRSKIHKREVKQYTVRVFS